MKVPKSILLVEDDKDDQEFFIEALGEIGNASLYYVANNGKEALEQLETSDFLPDLIFTDINMPVMNGIECLSEIIRNPQIRNIPVVFLTTDIRKIELARELGAKAFIKIPRDSKILRAQLEQNINPDFIFNDQITNNTFQTGF